MARRICVVTGASSGIGEATARRLATDPAVHVVLVARREERLASIAASLGERASYVAVDVTADEAPGRVREHLLERCGGELHLLVNNAGASWRARFGDEHCGWANVARHMAVNFDAVVRLTDELLPLLRASAPSAVVNVSSVAGRVARAGAGGYSASKFALAGWSESLHAEEREHGVHVGLVLPGFVATEGFPAEELVSKRLTSWLVSTDDKAVAAVVETGLHGRAERYVPRPWRLIPVLRVLLPGVVRRVTAGKGASVTVTKTKPGS